MRVASLSLLLALLAGCATYHPAPLDPGKNAAAFEARSLDDPGLQQFLREQSSLPIASPRDWDVHRLSLVALYYHADLEVARAKWKVAQAAAITAGAKPNPGISSSIEYNADAADGTRAWSPGVGLSVPIETAGKRRERIAQALQQAEAARLNFAEAAWQVRSRVRSALLGTVPTEPLLRQQQTLEAERVRLMRRRVEIGFAAQPELTSVQIALQQVSLLADEAHKRLAENRAALAASLGLPVAALTAIKLSLGEFEHVPAMADLPSLEVQRQALLHRPDVLSALAEYRASEAALRLEVANQYPDLTLSPGLLWDAGQAKWSLGLSLVLPLFDRNQGPIAEARAKREQAAKEVFAVQSRAIGEVERTLAGYRSALEKLRNADVLLATERRSEASAIRIQRAGESERSVLLDAQVERNAAELARLETLLQAQQALGALEDALREPIADAVPLASPAELESDPRGKDGAP